MDYPLQSLQESRWFKLICGASFQHLPAVRNLVVAYALAGADCIDVAADPAVVSAALEGIQAAQRHSPRGSGQNPGDPNNNVHHQTSFPCHGPRPWLMVSLNDGEDPHFRKAAFDPIYCPSDCPRPCETICPTDAIVFPEPSLQSVSSPALAQSPTNLGSATNAGPAIRANSTANAGVIRDRCYGCGRCIPVCPMGHITAESYIRPAGDLAVELFPLVDAVEIHTQVGRRDAFQALWNQISPQLHHLKLISISCPNHDHVISYLRSLHAVMTQAGPLSCALIWQTDGRPMSGDIGQGTTHATIRLAQKAIAAQLPGFVQLAGGTNHHTVSTLRALNLLPHPTVGGVAYGSYARKILRPVLDQLEPPRSLTPPSSIQAHLPLETDPSLLHQAVSTAHSLVSQIKQSRLPSAVSVQSSAPQPSQPAPLHLR